ncbi:MAG: hypothetical protein MZV65_25740 [Chromatiales bacterium]|nr:hypothetical protein [Chromatiales bacterium]
MKSRANVSALDEDLCFETAVVIRADTVWICACGMWAKVVALAYQHFERTKAQSVLAEALTMAREMLHDNKLIAHV